MRAVLAIDVVPKQHASEPALQILKMQVADRLLLLHWGELLQLLEPVLHHDEVGAGRRS